MAHWLVKTEPEVYSITDLKRDRVTFWDGVRNYQARNYLRSMTVGEQVLIYHSNAEPPAIVGLAKVAKLAYADPTQFDKQSEYYDPKATPESPRWFGPDLRFVRVFKNPLALPVLREQKELEGMVLLQRGSRLSVQPVTDEQLTRILELAA